VSLQQELIDLFMVSVIAALTPIVAGLLSRLRVPHVVVLIVGGVWSDRRYWGGLTRPALNWYPTSVSGSSSYWQATNSSSGCSASGPDGSH
jgi:Kef-type K+ transport system membrane component KefB